MTAKPSGAVRRQHLVSKVLLKQWAVDGELTAFNLETGTARARSPKAEGFEIDFVLHGATLAEARWQDFEQRAADALLATTSGTLFAEDAHVVTIKGLLGLHLVRSRVATSMWNRALKRQVGQGASSHTANLIALINDPDVQDAIFENLTGLQPAGDEARSIAQNHLAAEFDRRLGTGGEAFAEVLRENLDRFVEENAARTVEVGVSERELLIGDVPALTVDHATRSVGFLAGVTIAAADTLFMPVGPHHVVGLGGSGEFRDLPDAASDTLNHLQLISAHRKVYMRRTHRWSNSLRPNVCVVPNRCLPDGGSARRRLSRSRKESRGACRNRRHEASRANTRKHV